MFLFCSVSAPSSSSDKSSVINLLSAAQQRYRVNSLLMNMMDTKQRPRRATWMLILLISDRPVNTWMFQQWLHQFLQTLMWHIPHFVIFHKCNRKLETCRTNAGVSLSIFNKVLKTKLFPNMVFLHTSNSSLQAALTCKKFLDLTQLYPLYYSWLMLMQSSNVILISFSFAIILN